MLKNKYYRLGLLSTVVTGLMIVQAANALDYDRITLVKGSFVNQVSYTSPGGAGVAIFSGQVGPAYSWNGSAVEALPGCQPAVGSSLPPDTPCDDIDETLPQTERVFLARSSIGWPAPATIGWVDPNSPGLPDAPATAAEQLMQDGLTHVEALKSTYEIYFASDGSQDPNEIYLNYDFLTTDDGSSWTASEDQTFGIDVLFDETEAELAVTAMLAAYQANPYLSFTDANDNVFDVKNLLLDIFYYKSASLIMQGNLELERAFSIRFMQDLYPSGEPVDNELGKLGWDISLDSLDEWTENAWYFYDQASRVWLDLFTSPILRELLMDLSPGRDLDFANHPAFKDTTVPAGLAPEDWPPVVYNGYKDVSSMFRALGQRGRVIHEIAKRLVLKLERAQASTLIEEFVHQLSLEESIGMSFFFPDGLPADHGTKYPGLAESIRELRGAAMKLGQLREAVLNPDLNALGFDKNVLFVKAAVPNQTNPPTFDWFKTTLMADGVNPIGALGASFTADTDAENARKNFQLKAAQYIGEFDRIENEYDQQLISICGKDPSDSSKPNLEAPLAGTGLLSQQVDNVEIAQNSIERVTRMMQNVQSRIDNEWDRLSLLNDVSDRRITIINETTGAVADLQVEIGKIQADMAIASGYAAAVAGASGNLLTGFGGPAAAAHIANAYIQANGQKRIAKKQASITKLHGEQQSTFEFLSQEVNEINAMNQIKNYFLELRTLEIDMLDAEIRLGQELKRFSQLYTDMDDKIMRRDRALHRMTLRSFADPTYRIEATNKALEAEDRFLQAQTWVYLMAKALDYKWPTGNFGVEPYRQEIIRARTAKELRDITQDSLIQFDNIEQGNAGLSFYYSNFSLRQDYMGMTFDKEIPDTDGQIKTEYEQFTDYLQSLLDDPENIVQVDFEQYLAIPFSTVKFSPYKGILPLMNVDDSNGNTYSTVFPKPVFVNGLWNCKLDWLQINVFGNNVYDYSTSMMMTQVWYGGSGFVRTANEFADPTDPTKTSDYIVYPNPAYSFSTAPEGRGISWETKEYIKATTVAKLVSNPREVPDFVFRNSSFVERPVAATDWRILIPINGTNFANIRDIEINMLYKGATIQ